MKLLPLKFFLKTLFNPDSPSERRYIKKNKPIFPKMRHHGLSYPYLLYLGAQLIQACLPAILYTHLSMQKWFKNERGNLGRAW